MDQLKSIKKHCDRHLLDYTIEEGHLILKDEVFMIVDKNITIFDEKFQIHKDIYSKVDQYANGIVYEFGGIWYIQKVGEDVSMTELKNTGKAKQKLPTKSFLGIHSGNELLNGIGSYKDWIKKAKFLGVNTLGICEKNSLSGVMGFQNDCKDSNIKSIIGMTLSVVNEKESYEVKLYTKNFQGWLNLLKFSEIINVNGDTAVKEDFLKDNLEGIFVITDPKTTSFESRFKQADFYMVDTVEFDIAETDKKYIDNLELYLKSDLKPIAIFDAYCLEKSDWEAREILWGIGKKFSDKTKNQYFKNNDIYASELIGLFEQGNTSWIRLYKESNKNLDELVSQCNFMYDTVNRRLPKYKMNEWEKDNFKANEDLFMHYIKLGFAQKKIVDKNKYVERLKEEISVLKKGDVIDYFLVQRDIIAEAKEKGMLTGIGRGCFVAGSKVKMSNGTFKSIEDVKVGDNTFNHFFGKSEVINTFIYDINEEIVELNFGENVIRCTKDHKFFTKNRGWVEADKLTELDEVQENKRQGKFLDAVKKIGCSVSVLLKVYEGKMNFNDALLFLKNGFSSKRSFTDFCLKCEKKYSKSISGLKINVHKLNNCSKCALSEALNSKLAKSNNSKAQIIAQNKPNQKLNNKINAQKYWNVKENKDKASAIMRNLYISNPKYIKNVTNALKNSGEVHTVRFGKIIFNGLLELAYIIDCDKNLNIINFKNYDRLPIKYKIKDNEEYRSYFPDFIVNGKVIEVKRNMDNLLSERLIQVNKKSHYAKIELCEENYNIIQEKDLTCKYISKRRYVHNYNYKIKFYNETKV